MKTRLKISLLLSGIAISACQTSMSEPDEVFGMAVKHNIAVQTVEPMPEQKQNTYIRPNSARMKKAKENYENDDVDQPQSQKLTD